ncbi:hypothetical protein IYY11_21290 [Methylocystis sp. H62]|uniref:PIN-like domain-containing protein n=1 Tax=Methylocystis sp. H62 TaxID=2785789 RepID=UPI0018C2A62E|nr:hypothetical protein [Methylocystis sp. H62]MBG0795896.1 hypothetical protein [Methylocystis sp. H62]
MKVLLDEHLPPALARALNALFAGEHEIIHLRDRFGPRVTDVEWIEALGREGRWIVISADRRITRNKAEYHAFRNSKLIGFFMSPSLYKSKITKQAERLLALWEGIVDLAGRVEGGAMFELPMKTTTRFRQLKP